MRTRIKFCGITNPACAAAAARAGADAVGFVFYPPAPVAVDAEAAARAAAALPPFVAKVALFVDAEVDTVRRVVEVLRPQYLQFHGGEDAAFCRQFNTPYIKARRVRAAADIRAARAEHPDCCALLLDAYADDKPGGTGKTFDWSLLPSGGGGAPLIVAGGLTAENVGGLIRAARPWAVDVSSGVAEDGNRRRKNYDKMKSFYANVRDADFH